MDSATTPEDRRNLTAYAFPMAAFLAALALASGLRWLGGGFWLRSPEYWVYPLQTFVCAAVLWWFRRDYEFQRLRGIAFTIALATFVFVLWIAPQAFLGFPARIDGFNPDVFQAQPAVYWVTVALRFARLVVVVPLVEELFWRGFLLRYFISERFTSVPFGAFSWFSFAAVTLGFMFVHGSADWPAAAITGMLYNFVAYRAKSLSSCVLAHACTNLLLGLWIMHTRQWGFW